MPTKLILTDPSWDRITAAAKAQVSAELERDSQADLVAGQPIAWSVSAKVGGATDWLSSVHRVGAPKGNAAYTSCGVPIPDPVMWFPLSPVLVKSLAPCGFCEAAMASTEWGHAA